MEVGAPAVGLSLLLPATLVAWVVLAHVVVTRARAVPDGAAAWTVAAAGGYLAYLSTGLAAAEILGAFDALDRPALMAWWGSVLVVVTTAARSLARRRPRAVPGTALRLDAATLAALALVGALAGFLFWLGVVAAPNNPDSMGYHLVRAATWATNHNVDDFPTRIELQAYYGRLAEYFLTQILVLDGTDRLAFVNQWLAYVSSIAMAGGLARWLGGRRAGLLALVVTASLPLGVMQATTPQNDLFVASITLAAFVGAVALWRRRRPHIALVGVVTAGAGLALVTKLDAAAALVPLAVGLGVMAWWQRWRWRAVVSSTVLGAVGVLLLSAPVTVRNVETFGGILGPPQAANLAVSTANPVQLGRNALRDLLLNVDTLSGADNGAVDRFDARVGAHLGLDRTVEATSSYRTWPQGRVSPTEDASGDMVALGFVLAALVALAWPGVRRRSLARAVGALTLCSGLAFLSDCTVLKYQPYSARFELTGLLPLVAAAAVVLAGVSSRVLAGVVLAVVVGAGAWSATISALFDQGKPVLGPPGDYLAQPRLEQMFHWCPGLQAPYTAAVDAATARHSRELGYVPQVYSDFVYPLWVLLSQQAHGAPVRLVQLFVDNPTRRDGPPPGRPPVVLVSGATLAEEQGYAAPLGPLGYHRSSLTPTTCGVMAIYTRGG